MTRGPREIESELTPSQRRELLARLLRRRSSRERLSFAQERLWFLHHLVPGSAVYNVPAAVRLSGPLDVEALERSLAEVMARHEVLRTRFERAREGPVPVVEASVEVALEPEDLGDVPAAERQARALERANEEVRRPFDLERGPLLRARLLRLGAEEHLLVLTLHHIVAEGWSVALLFAELERLYAAFVAGEASPLEELPMQYAGYARWQRRRAREGALAAELDYWRRRLDGELPVLELPTDRPRPPVQTFDGAWASCELGAELRRGAEALAQAEAATLFMVLLAAFQTLLHRYTGQTDILVGSPIAGRNRAEAEQLVGVFLNTLVLRTDLSGDPRFTELLERVRETAVGALSHQEIPFERVVEKLAPDRHLSHTPIFQVMFAMQNMPRPRLALEGLEPGRLLGPDRIHNATTKVDLALFVEETDGALRVGCEYSTDLFDAATVERLLEHYRVLLRGIVAAPAERLSRLPLLAAAERRRLLVDWNRTAADYPAERTVHELFEAQVDERGDAEAVVYGDTRLSYRQLDRRANRLAHHLLELGVQDEDRVALFLEPSADLIAAKLAVLGVGCAYLPLDPRDPDDRLRFMLDDAGAALVLTESSLRGRLEDVGATVVSLDEPGGPAAPTAASRRPGRRSHPDDLAYLIYTSGSTGRPKAVAVPHRAVVRLVAGTDYIDIHPGERVGQASNISFDAATFEIWGALLNGATLVGIDRHTLLSARRLSELVERHGLHHLFLTTALLNALVAEAPEALSGLTTLLFGGEAVDTQRVRQVLEHGRPRRFLHVYGPTENTTFSTWYEIDGASESGTVPIGRAVANSTAYVLDERLEPVPIGLTGELYVGGVGLARGYWGRAELTAASFVPDSFADLPGSRLYRTGDLVRWNADGQLEFLGRDDSQVKVRGFRVELREIELALSAHEAVRQAVVLADDGGPAGVRLAAFVVTSRPHPSGGELRAHLRRRLPGYMIPATLTRLDEMPLSPSGKIDRTALPALESERQPAGASAAPRGEAEHFIASVWRRALDIDGVGRDDNFFDLGGHSLLLVLVHGELQRHFDCRISMVDMFRHPTIAALASFLTGIAGSGRSVETGPGEQDTLSPGATPSQRRELLARLLRRRSSRERLSFAQERLWFLHHLVPGSAVYNVPAAVRLSGPLDVEALERSLAEVMARHEVLRTRFERAREGPVPVVEASVEVALEPEDLGDVPAAERQARALERANEEVRRPFDLERGPLLRARLLRLGAEEHLLVLTLHHIVAEGWSVALLFAELERLYAAFVAGEASPLEELPMQYAGYARWQRRRAREGALAAELDYWRRRLDGELPVLELPTDRPRPPVQTFDGAWASCELGAELRRGAEALAQAEAATLFMVLLAAFQTLLHRYTGQTDILVGSPIAGRNRAEAEQLVGVFLNTLVLRTDLSGDPRFTELLERVRETAVGALSHQEIPFERVVEKLAPDRHLSHTPIFQVMFAMQNMPRPRLALEGLEPGRLLGPDRIHNATTKVDLALFVEETDGALRVGCEYSTDLFDAATVERLLEHYRVLLRGIVAAPSERLSRLPLLAAAERRRLLVDWNRTAADYPAERTVHELFEAQVAERGDAEAVVYGDTRLSYRQLDRRANRLAHHLLELGVQDEDRVALLSRPSEQVIVAMLAVAKTGGAYLPLDPAYPPERLALLLEDAGVEILLTQRSLHDHLPPASRGRRSGDRLLCLDDDAAWRDRSPEPPERRNGPGRLAYVIYTSGSTGRPKAVELENRGLANLAAWHRATYQLSPDDRTTQLAGLAFDASVWEIWPSLTAGATLHVVDEETRLSPEALIGYLADHDITVCFAPTPLAEVLLQRDWPSGVRLRQLLTGGSRLHHPAPPETPFELVNHYGPTENTVVSTAGTVPAADGERPPTIGRPIWNQHIYLLDGHLEPVPIGIPGEIHVAGPGLARCYRQQPMQTAERFLPDPFGAGGGRMYATGDLGRYLPDGRIEFLGRRDHQIKVRGYRVELGEIEATLRSHPGVHEAVVVSTPGADRHSYLAAYVTSLDRDPPSAGELRRYVRRSLPGYMIPAVFVPLATMPLTPNGKIDRAALPPPSDLDHARPTGATAPQRDLERRVAKIWGEILPTSDIGLDDNFFELGGHSLMLLEVHARLGRVLERELSVVDMFRYPTIGALVTHLDDPDDDSPHGARAAREG